MFGRYPVLNVPEQDLPMEVNYCTQGNDRVNSRDLQADVHLQKRSITLRSLGRTSNLNKFDKLRAAMKG